MADHVIRPRDQEPRFGSCSVGHCSDADRWCPESPLLHSNVIWIETSEEWLRDTMEGGEKETKREERKGKREDRKGGTKGT